MLDYFRTAGAEHHAPFNGQSARLSLVETLMGLFPPRLIVETGTYRGDTTAFFGSISTARTISVEAHPYFYAYSSVRHWRNRRVTVVQGDSGECIASLAIDPAIPKDRAFFYLDAHASGIRDLDVSVDPLPLGREIATILNVWSESLVMIDDCKVESDEGYGFDDYGDSGAIELSYLLKNCGDQLEAAADLYFPTTPSEQETGARRGMLLIAVSKEPAFREAVAAVPFLRPADF